MSKQNQYVGLCQVSKNKLKFHYLLFIFRQDILDFVRSQLLNFILTKTSIYILYLHFVKTYLTLSAVNF